MPKRNAPPTETSDHNKYLTRSQLEISKILHALAREATQVTASLAENDFFLTSVLEVDPDADQVSIESGKRNFHKARILAGQHIACTASLEKIQIRFQLDSLELAETHDGEEVFVAPLPRELFRMQRREYFRMTLPMLPPVTCSISPIQKDAPPAIDVKLADISCGGIAVIAPPEIFSPELGTRYECTLELPGSQPLKAQLQARNNKSARIAMRASITVATFKKLMPPDMHAACQPSVKPLHHDKRQSYIDKRDLLLMS